jgi:hypothetical protein
MVVAVYFLASLVPADSASVVANSGKSFNID